MSRNDFTLSVLGARGSMSHADPALALYGGDSSCYLVRAGEESVFLDAGSGMLHAPARYPRTPAVLLSHLHLDHLIGLGLFPGLMVRGQGLRILVPFCSDREAAERSLERVYAPPFWPIRLSQGECGVELLPLAERFAVGELAVETMVGNHPGGGMLFKLSYHGRSLIYATDYEHEPRTFEALAEFAQGAELLLYDAQYSRARSCCSTTRSIPRANTPRSGASDTRRRRRDSNSSRAAAPGRCCWCTTRRAARTRCCSRGKSSCRRASPTPDRGRSSRSDKRGILDTGRTTRSTEKRPAETEESG